MTAQSVLKEFLEKKFSKKEQRQFSGPILDEAFSDLDKVLRFTKMSRGERCELLNYIAGIRINIRYPSKKSKNKFFSAVNGAVRALRKLRSTQWGGFDPEVNRSVIAVETELKNIFKIKKNWERGRRLEINRPQLYAIKKIYELLEQSRRQKNSRWKKFQIEQYGQFHRRREPKKISSKFEATPARLISNLAKGLRVNLSELAVGHVIKRD